jgi:probable HAF family extracellular repeat protein
MKSKALISIITVLAFAALMFPRSLAAQSPSADHVHYRVINLGTLGGTASTGNGINNLNWVTGAANRSGDQTQEATLWAYGLKIPLGTLGGPNSGVLFPSKANNGEIAGVSETAKIDPYGEDWSCSAFFPSITGHTCVGFVWRFGMMVPLPTLGGDNGFAAGINDRGQIVGWAENTVHDPTCQGRNQVLQFEAVVWGPGGDIEKQLSPFPGDPDGAAVAINDEGQVVGISGTCDQAVGRFSAKHAVLWQNGTVTDLGNLGGEAWNTPDAINQEGQIVGFSDLPGDSDGNPNFHGVFWPKTGGPQCQGHCIDLGTLQGDSLSEATGINNKNQIVGLSIGGGSPFGSRAFLWENGKMVDLNQLVVPGTTLQLIVGGDINDRGEITGAAIDPNPNATECGPTTPGCAFLAIPVRDEDQN